MSLWRAQGKRRRGGAGEPSSRPPAPRVPGRNAGVGRDADRVQRKYDARKELPLNDRQAQVLALLPATAAALRDATGLNASQVRSALSGLAMRDRAWNDQGTWRAK